MNVFAERLWIRSQRYIAENQIAAARATLESLVQREPERVAARMLLASVYLSEGRMRPACEQTVAASVMLPEDAGAVATTTQCLLRIGEAVAARECLLRFDAPNRKLSGEEFTAIAHAYQMLGLNTTALMLMDRARAAGFDNADFRYFYALQLQFNGHIAAAQRELESCLELGPAYGRACLTLARGRKQTLDSNHIDFILDRLRSVEQGSEDHAAFEFALFEELEDLGEYGAAFEALQRGNEIMYARQEHDPQREAAVFDALINLTDARFFESRVASRAEVTEEEPIPVFVVGLPRSGTTLLDRLLDNHSRIRSAGERTDFPLQLRWAADLYGKELIDEPLLDRLANVDYAEVGRRYLAQTRWRAGGQNFFVDKLPANYMLLGFIHLALPHAPILHLVRSPMDVCFSNYKALFGDNYPYSYKLEPLASHYRAYRRLMRHWHERMPGRILDVDYAALVKDPASQMARILAHCGLDFQSACIDPTRNRTAVNTLSSTQVREGIHTNALGAWRRYRQQLEPLRRTLQVADDA